MISWLNAERAEKRTKNLSETCIERIKLRYIIFWMFAGFPGTQGRQFRRILSSVAGAERPDGNEISVDFKGEAETRFVCLSNLWGEDVAGKSEEHCTTEPGGSINQNTSGGVIFRRPCFLAEKQFCFVCCVGGRKSGSIKFNCLVFQSHRLKAAQQKEDVENHYGLSNQLATLLTNMHDR